MSCKRDATIVTMSVMRMMQVARFVGLIVVFVASLPSLAIAETPKGLKLVQEKHSNRFRDFSNEIEKLAKSYDEKSMTEEAKKIREVITDSQSLRVDKLPAEIRPQIPVDADGEKNWKAKLRLIQANYAQDLFRQAKMASVQKFPVYAYDLVREAAQHDPDHRQVRKVLGYVLLDKKWLTPVAASQIKDGNVWDEDFGWIRKTYQAKYQAGQRYYKKDKDDKGIWITADKEKELRRDFKSAWEIRTDHYLIKTNVSLEKGVELGKALEDFYGVFYDTFAGFFNTPEQLEKLFDVDAKTDRQAPIPHKVNFYRTRDEYLEKLRKFFPSIDQTNGVYMTSDRVAHFYFDPDNDHEGTLFHEASHQLFFESQSSSNRTICENHHFWIIEGIACYMESFQRKNGTFSLGDPKYVRFTRARYNLLQEKYYVPLREFSGYGMQEFQNFPQPELTKNYTQAAGLARFFMHYDKGRYREALVRHLSQLYSGNDETRARAQGLDVLTGVEFSELDRQYAEDAR